MSDAREKQPRYKTIDLTAHGCAHRYYAVIRTSPYSSIKPEDVHPEYLTVIFKARDFDHAADFAKAMATIIQIGHDVHQATVQEVGRTKFDHVTRPAERPVVGA